MTGVAFVLFTNYMITDPGTTPTVGHATQFMFGSGVAIVYGVLMRSTWSTRCSSPSPSSVPPAA